MSAILELQAVVGGYGDTHVLRGVSLAVQKDEIVVVIGPNGAGKSSTLKAVLGLLRIREGSIRLAGAEITGQTPERLVRSGISVVPQTRNVFPTLTVNENFEMGAFTRDHTFRRKLDEIYQLFPPLVAKRRQPAGTLSGGQRQMVAMGRALMADSKILLLDEPTAGLSPKYRAEIFEIVRRINGRGIPILMVEQNAREALAIADRGYVLVDGKDYFTGTGKELLEDPSVGEMFLGGARASASS